MAPQDQQRDFGGPLTAWGNPIDTTVAGHRSAVLKTKLQDLTELHHMEHSPVSWLAHTRHNTSPISGMVDIFGLLLEHYFSHENRNSNSRDFYNTGFLQSSILTFLHDRDDQRASTPHFPIDR